jgi:O-antigen/teichoic acid export membrane protein
MRLGELADESCQCLGNVDIVGSLYNRRCLRVEPGLYRRELAACPQLQLDFMTNEPATAKPQDRIAGKSMVQSAFHALLWRYAGTVFQAALQFVVGVALARLLTPEAFGIVAMAMISIGFARLIGDLGFGAAIIQYPNLTTKHVRAAFTGSMLAGTVLFLLLWLLSPAISRFFNDDALTPMVRAIGVSLIVSGTGVVSAALLRRELKFQLLTVLETASYAVGFGIVGVSMAVLHYGAWSLIVANVVQPLCLVAFSVPFGNQPIRPWFGIREYRELCRLASAEITNNVVNFAAENLHFFLIGRWLGASALGLFSRSFYLMHLPVMHFSFALWSVLFPLYSMIQTDIARLGRAFLHTISLTAVLTIPVFVAMAVAPELIIGGLFGEQWKPAAASFRILCLSGPLLAMMRVFGAVSHARGYIYSESGRQVIYFWLLAVALWFLFPFGLNGIALAVVLGCMGRYLLLAQLAIELSGVKWTQFLSAQLPGVIVGAVVGAPVYLATTVGELILTSDVSRLLLNIAVAGAFYALSFAILPLSWFGELGPWFIDRFGPRLPPAVREFVNTRLNMARIV